jgi:hypothetical protein
MAEPITPGPTAEEITQARQQAAREAHEAEVVRRAREVSLVNAATAWDTAYRKVAAGR